jgi:hypothetical protein
MKAYFFYCPHITTHIHNNQQGNLQMSTHITFIIEKVNANLTPKKGIIENSS